MSSRAAAGSTLRPGFLAVEDLSGRHWRPGLAEALGFAEVFVPLLSPEYYRRSWPRQEWSGFMQGLRDAGVRDPQRRIAPVLWQPLPVGVETPELRAALSLATDSSLATHAQNGLYYLQRQRDYQDFYHQVARELATRIVAIAEKTPLTPSAVRLREADLPLSHGIGGKVFAVLVAGRPDILTHPASPAQCARLIAERQGYAVRMTQFSAPSGQVGADPGVFLVDAGAAAGDGAGSDLDATIAGLPPWVLPVVVADWAAGETARLNMTSPVKSAKPYSRRRRLSAMPCAESVPCRNSSRFCLGSWPRLKKSIFGIALYSALRAPRSRGQDWLAGAAHLNRPSRRIRMTDSPPEDEPRLGHVVTFYSYKGGTGRTMALANVAWILASSGRRVLVADWDLESPGLHRFFAPFLEQSVQDATGIIDVVREYEYQAGRTDDEKQRRPYIAEYTRIRQHTIQLNWEFPKGGSLEFLSPGKQNTDYMATIGALDWDNFYKALSGGEFLDALRADMKAQYDYALIDSRTGLSDVADICTVHLPDVLVDCFTLSTQGIEGSAQVAKSIEERHGFRGIKILPVPMRVDPFEQERVEVGKIFAQRLFENLPSDMTAADRRTYWNAAAVPYRPYYAYEEKLAVFGDLPGDPGSVLSAYERITGYITDGDVTGLPAMDEAVRSATRDRFEREPPLETRRITIESLPEDRVWMEWISAALSAASFTVTDRRLGDDGPEPGHEVDGQRTVTIASDAYLAWRHRHHADATRGTFDLEPYRLNGQQAAARPGFAVCVGSVRSVPEFSPKSTVVLSGVRDTDDALKQLARLFRIVADSEYRAAALPRYPGADARVSGLRERSDKFTGRENDLAELRGQLRSFSTAVVRPVALLGTAGAGKTAIALEYAHRFMNDYDLVCWIRCGRSAEIDTRVAEIAPLLEDRFDVRIPADATVEQQARAVLDVLGDGESVPRRLLIYDNAEDIETVKRYMPRGGGRVLITSQNQTWEDNGVRPIRVRMLERPESVALLLREVPHLTGKEAVALAEALGDLPVAIISVAAYLRDSGYPVARYLSGLEGSQPRTPVSGVLSVYPPEVAGAWDAPLGLLEERSAASPRLLELISVMAPEVSLDLIYSRAMAEVLTRYDAALAEPLIMGRVVQEAIKLNLLTLDSATRNIIMHRVVQAVVRNRMTAEQRAGARADVQQVLLAARPRRDVDDPETWSRYRLLWPHLESAEVVSSANDQVRQLVIDRVRYIYVFSDYERGLKEAAEAAAVWENMRAAADDPAVKKVLSTQLLQLQYNSGNILLRQSRFAESRELHELVHARQCEILFPEHPHTLMTALSLAADLRALGLYGDALGRDEQTQPAWVDLYGDNHFWSLRAANNLAVSLRLNGNVRAALQLDRDTLTRLQAPAFGKGHPLTLSSAQNLARDHLECGEYGEAAKRARSAYDDSVEAMGPDSVAALDGKVLLGIALRSEGKPKEAEALFQEALELLTARFGDSASAMLACRLSSAVNMWSLEHFAEAEEEIRYVLAAYERFLRPNHPHALVCRVNLAATLRQRLAPEQAAVEISIAREGLERELSAEHPYTLAAEMVQGVLLADAEEFGLAAELQARTFSALARALGTTHPDTLRARANLLLTRRDLGHDTTEDLRRTISQLEVLLGAEHPTVLTLRKNRRLLRALDPQPF